VPAHQYTRKKAELVAAILTGLMKYSLLIIYCFAVATCAAQRAHTPDPDAKIFHDAAIRTYVNNSKNKDSIVAAISLARHAVMIDSTFHDAWNNKLTFECQGSLYDSAYKTSKRMVSLFPADLDDLFFCGIMAYKTSHESEANKIFTKLVKIYGDVNDPNTDSDHLRIAELNKGLALKLLGQEDESKQMLVNLSMKEKDLTIRRHINTYIAKTREDIINEMIAKR